MTDRRTDGRTHVNGHDKKLQKMSDKLIEIRVIVYVKMDFDDAGNKSLT